MTKLPWRSFLVGLLLSGAIGYAWLGRLERAAAPSPAPVPTLSPDPTGSPARSAEAPEPAPSPATPPIAKAGGAVHLDRASFPASGPVRVSLELPVPSADDSPRPVRLISQPDHRILEIDGAIESGRGAATIAVDSTYLQPGTYLVEMKTTEQSAMPLRRYFIVVR